MAYMEPQTEQTNTHTHNDWTHSHVLHTLHYDNTKAVYIQNHVGVYLALRRERQREREREGGIE